MNCSLNEDCCTTGRIARGLGRELQMLRPGTKFYGEGARPDS